MHFSDYSRYLACARDKNSNKNLYLVKPIKFKFHELIVVVNHIK